MFNSIIFALLIFSNNMLGVVSINHQEYISKRTFRVMLNISASEDIQSEITSYISRELRSFKDILIVEKDPYLRVSIVALANKINNNKVGYSISVVVAKRLEPAMIKGVIAAFVEKETAGDFMYDMFAGGETMLHHSVITGPDIHNLCKSIVADIDGDVIEAERKEFQTIIDDAMKGLEKNGKKP